MKEYRLKYQKTLAFKAILSFMAPRVLAGLEVVGGDGYARTFRLNGTRGYFTVHDCAEKSFLVLRIHDGDGDCHRTIRDRVRRMFDMDTDLSAIQSKLGQDRRLVCGMEHGQVPPLPIAFDPFEMAVRAVLGQQVSVTAATTLAARVAERANLTCGSGYPKGLNLYFPDASEMLDLALDGLGITRIRQATLKNVVHGYLEHHFKLTANQSFETFYKEFIAIKGIGDWTVNYVAMRGLGMQDSFPDSDLGVIKALTRGNTKPTKTQILKIAEKWRPYRAYATLCLWNALKVRHCLEMDDGGRFQDSERR